MDLFYTTLKFLAAGLIIVGITVIVQITDPKIGGILAAAPITTTLAFIFTSSESGREITRQLVLGSFIFAIPTFLFLLVLYVLLSRFSFLPSICGAYLVWAFGVVSMQRISIGW